MPNSYRGRAGTPEDIRRMIARMFEQQQNAIGSGNLGDRLGARAIAAICGVSRNTARKYLREAAEAAEKIKRES